MAKRITLLIMLLTVTLAACSRAPDNDREVATKQPGTDSTVTGRISLQGASEIPDGAVVEISLLDVSRQDTAARVIAKQRISGVSNAPVDFELLFDPEEIDQRMSYSVGARVTHRGDLVYVTTSSMPVLTRGAGNSVDLSLTPVSPSSHSAAVRDDRLRGMFRYMADAALFRDCRNDKVYPVSMEAGYIELERAYLNSGISPGQEVMIELDGRLLERPAMEGNNNEVKLIVDKLHYLDIDNACKPEVHADLTGTYWKLLEVGGVRVVTRDGAREAHMILATQDSKVKGHAGCNNFFGSFQAGKDSLHFSAIGATRMACADGMTTEQAFLQALESVTHFRISGLFLSLYQENALLARFEAVYL